MDRARIDALIADVFAPSAPRPKKRKIDLNDVPSTDARAGRMAGEASNYQRTWGDTGQDVEAILREVATAQPKALLKAYEEPGIGTATNAVAQTALLANQPMKALGAVGAGLGASVLDDTDLLGLFSDAEADEIDPLGPSRARFDELQAKLKKGKTLSRAEREEQNTYLQTIQAAQTAKIEAETAKQSAADRSKQTEYDEAVDYAEKVRDDALAKDYRFQDTELGKTWNEVSGVAPFAAAFGAGALTRLGTGPGKDFVGKAINDYALPIVSGTGAAFAAQNVPLFGNMGAPANNPQKEAYLAYARELPEGHPRKQEMMAYAQSLPDDNPVQKEAYDQFNEGLNKRLGVAALEGVTFGKLGASSVNVGGRALDSFRGRGGPTTSPVPDTGPAPPVPPTSTAPVQSPYAGNYSSYPKLPAEVRDDLRTSYADDVSAAGATQPARGVAQGLTDMLKNLGINVDVPAGRVNEINKAVRGFMAQNGRMPNRDEIMRMFNSKTLSIPLTAGVGAGAMGDEDIEALLAEIMGGGG